MNNRLQIPQSPPHSTVTLNHQQDQKLTNLSGYTQSGPLFRSKTRALEKLLVKALTPLKLRPTLVYPTAPNRLSARDIPGYQPPESSTHDGAPEDDNDQTDAWAWFRKDEATSSYRLLDVGMHALASAIRDVPGPIDGVIGFSQGGAVAAMLAAALETPHREAPTETESGWVDALREANGGRPLKFAVVYSGFFAMPKELGWLYAPRKIGTPTLHFLGGLDTVVEESRSQALVERCEEGEDGKRRVVVTHPGGHYVPVSKDWVGVLVGFVREWGTKDDGAPQSEGTKEN